MKVPRLVLVLASALAVSCRAPASKSVSVGGAPTEEAGLSLITEPSAGMTPIYALLRSPRRSLELVMYELEDPTAEDILASDADAECRSG